MAEGGSNVKAMRVRVDGNRLVTEPVIDMAKTVVVDAHEALELLRAGQAANLRMYGLNFVSLWEGLRKAGVEVGG